MTTRIVIIGAGDFGRTLAAYVADLNDVRLMGFYDDVKVADRVVAVEGSPILGKLSDIYQGHSAGLFDAVVMGIGYKHLVFRSKLYSDLSGQGIAFATLVHATAFVHSTATVGPGTILFPRCVVDVNAKIGANSVLNTGCIIAHDTNVGDGSFLGPGVTLAGFVSIGSRCFIGVGTVVKDNLTIENDSRTGAGSVVVKDVQAGTLVVGVPARPFHLCSGR